MRGCVTFNATVLDSLLGFNESGDSKQLVIECVFILCGHVPRFLRSVTSHDHLFWRELGEEAVGGQQTKRTLQPAEALEKDHKQRAKMTGRAGKEINVPFLFS